MYKINNFINKSIELDILKPTHHDFPPIHCQYDSLWPTMTAGSRLCKWPTGQDLDLDYNSRVGRVDRDVFLEFQLNANYVAKSIISDSELATSNE